MQYDDSHVEDTYQLCLQLSDNSSKFAECINKLDDNKLLDNKDKIKTLIHELLIYLNS